ncbi:spore gernimation protein [Bacillus canaveralius]|uniref:Spore gernimation protein n=1 Tax=Bacillus canaveralius TaxID=1403243 RepID=A0A2N5GID9_9BACI|nr:endospore germination permease [Bacillus canaveralius]PLR80694.1 spore gernimation protein [Bacillus canaveralius]PLR89111.1 spore gernimation protein [Bacillus canaveralius]RSK48173.1 spore gernimation protein [Bacillus canaveralius]
MLEKGKISVSQFTVLMILFMLGPAILFSPSVLAAEAKQDAWMAAALGGGIGLLFVWLYTTIGNRFPGMTLVEYCEEILGKWLGKIVALLYFSFFFILAALLLRNIGDFVTVQIMPETPIEVIHIMFLSVVIMGTRLGLEPIARAGEILMPWTIIFFLIVVFSIIPQIDFQKIQPVFEEGIKPVIRGSLSVVAFPYLETVIMLMLYPFVNSINKVRKAFLTGSLIGGIVIIIITALCILVLGADYTARNLYPSFVLARKIDIANFLQRIEAIVAGMWFITIFFKLTICFYASVLGLAQTLNLKEYRPLTLPLGMILVVLSIIISPNMVYFQTLLAKTWFPFTLTYGFFLPLLLLVVAIFRKKYLKEPIDKAEG